MRGCPAARGGADDGDAYATMLLFRAVCEAKGIAPKTAAKVFADCMIPSVPPEPKKTKEGEAAPGANTENAEKRPGTGKRGAAPWVKGEWKNNLWWDYSGKPVFNDRDWKYWTTSGNETGGVLADPKFADPDNFDFTLAPDSPAFKIGFRPFDPSQAGLRRGR